MGGILPRPGDTEEYDCWHHESNRYLKSVMSLQIMVIWAWRKGGILPYLGVWEGLDKGVMLHNSKNG